MSECEAGLLWWYDRDKFSWQIFHTRVLIMGRSSRSWQADWQHNRDVFSNISVKLIFLFYLKPRSDPTTGLEKAWSLIFQSSRDSFVPPGFRTVGPNFDTVLPPAILPLILSIMKSLYLTLSYFNCLLAVKINIASINKVG